jgi:hypothetical protein
MSVRLSGAGIVRLHAQVRLVPLKRGRCNLAHERPLCAARSFRSRPPSCAGARKTTQATHPSHVRGPLLLGMQVACAMQSNSAMRAMMSANSNVRRRGRATVQGTKNGALRSTCKGAGWTATVHPKHRLANVRHPHAAADSVEVRISQDCTVCESKCFTRSSSGAFTAPAGFLAGRGGDAQARRQSSSPTRCSPASGGSVRTCGASRATGCLPDIVTVGTLMGNGHLVWQGDDCGRR